MDDSGSSDEITEEEFEALLDSIQVSKASADVAGTVAPDGDGLSSPSLDGCVEASDTTGSAAQCDEFTEAEFEALLDRIAVEKGGVPPVAAGATGSGEPGSGTGTTSAIVDEYLGDLCVEEQRPMVIKLDANVDIAEVGMLHAQFLDYAASTAPIQIDGGNVEAIDTAVIQLLYALIHDALTGNRTVAWLQPSVALMQRVEMLGMTEQLHLSTVESKAA
jgi:anti-anti-sigma regulatory factor